MKKLSFVIIALFAFSTIQAQIPFSFDLDAHQKDSLNQALISQKSFFDADGLVYQEPQRELKKSLANKAGLFHRKDDVVWSRVVYRIVDMRFKQNYELYTPISADDKMNSSLLKTVLLAMADSMPVYPKSNNAKDCEVRPIFEKYDANKLVGEEALSLLDVQGLTNWDDEDVRKDQRVLRYDSTGVLTLNTTSYSTFAKNQLKYLIQEVVFFDKHYSRLYSKITAIAPMHADNVAMNSEMDPMQAVYGQILFWIKYDDLRPYLAQQYVTATDNNSNGVTLDDFFTLKLYSSYVLGVNNVYSRMVPQFVTNESDLEVKQKAIHREQRKIENELLNTEQDLWEY